MRRLVVVGLALIVVSGSLVVGAVAMGPGPWGPPQAAASPLLPSPSPSPSDAPSPSPSPTPQPSPWPSPSPSPWVAPSQRPSPRPIAVVSAELERAVAGWQARTGTPGVSVAIVWPGGRVWQRSSGIADAHDGEPVGPLTAFPYASVSKTFTAALILQLVDEGRLYLDELVAPWLPEAGLHPKMTIRHLLDHTSGLPDFFRVTGIEPALNTDTRKTWTVDDTLAFGLKDRVAPDTFWRYSNTGYVYLGLLAEAVTGRSWAELVRERLLDPLGLETVFIQGVEAPRTALARAHRVSGTGAASTARAIWPLDPLSPFTSVVTAAGAAGAIAGDAVDAARWAAALYGGSVVTPRLVDEAVRDVQRTARFHPRIPYGLGVQVVHYGTQEVWGHTGSFVGIRNVVRWLPDRGIAIVVLTNQSRYDSAVLARQLVEIVATLPVPPSCRGCD